IKRGGQQKKDAVARHAELWGLRKQKYDWLSNNDLDATEWRELVPKSEFYLFVPRTDKGLDVYERWPHVPEIFVVNSTGIKTHRDHFVFDFDCEALKRRIRQFRDRNLTDDFVRGALKLKDTGDWKMSERRKKVEEDVDWEDKIVKCLYRPFDMRWVFYHYHAIDRGRLEVMRHMLAGENVALITPKQHKDEFGAFTTETIGVHKSVAAYDTNYYFPLYLYPNADRDDLFAQHEPAERRPNLNPKAVAALAQAYGVAPSPEEIFHYVYAVLYAPAYREKYAEFLRMDFPRVPFTSDVRLFGQLVALGERLTALHLLTSAELDPPTCRFEVEGDSRIGKGKSAGLRYEAKEQCVYINATQYFAPVAETVWSYQVGGYQVCEKWLKDRQERRLDLDDIRTYCRIVTALGRTLVIQTEIDALYPGVEKNVVAIPGHTSEVESGSPPIGSTRRRTRRT
ncbi:MAG: DNA methyltransferase, partial [Deltaproteobacteria bacterium]|nr:DNA methyltransferase [Deltaproteobacteria bacterium]